MKFIRVSNFMLVIIGFDEQTARDFFYNVVVSYCKESLVDERLEALKEDFDD